jgi:hypothetical protein
MYEYPLISQQEFYQGDIIGDYPFLNLGQAKPLVISGEGFTDGGGEVDATTGKVSVGVDTRRVMIISQTCDAQRRENVIISPIYTLNEYIAASSPNADKLRTLRAGKIYYWFYLPAYQDIIEESFVDLQQVTYVPRAYVERYIEGRILSLSDLGRHRLSWSVAGFLGRPIELGQDNIAHNSDSYP